MSTSLEIVQEQLSSVDVQPAIAFALDKNSAMSSGELLPGFFAPVWSPVFNAFTRSCALLHQDPDEHLADRTVEIPDELGYLGSQFLKLINESVARDSSVPYKLKSSADYDPEQNNGKSDVCKGAEPSFLSYLNKLHHEDEGTDFYLGSGGKPIMMTKRVGTQKDGRTTLSLEDIAINGLTYPAGTIFMVERSGVDSIDQPIHEYDSATLLGLKSIGSIRPLRLSLFPIPKEERPEAIRRAPRANGFTSDDAFNHNQIAQKADIPFIETARQKAAAHVHRIMVEPAAQPAELERLSA